MASSAAALAMELPRLSEARTLDRQARLMVGFPAGSSPDFVARLLAEHLRECNQQISAADLIAAEATARALAAVRGRSEVWRTDLLDGLAAALVNDDVVFIAQDF